ncbi:MAG: nuclear transport factor 2 family protein [Hyphomonadaceae bacterium]
MRAFFAAIGLFFLCAAPAAAQEHGDAQRIALARAYLDAYAALDQSRLGALYAEDAEFNDPTSIGVEGIGGPFVWSGRAEILARIAEWSQTIQSLRYDIERIYESGGRVVVIGAVNPIMRTGERYRFAIVTILTIEDGRVREHRDYTNYRGEGALASPAQEAAQAYLAAYSAANWDGVAAMLAPGAIFTDRTAPRDRADYPSEISGRDAIVAALRGFGIGRFEYALTRTYESGGATAFIGAVSVFYPQPDGRTYVWRSSIVTVVTAENGRVTRQDDFADYAGAEERFE